MPRPECRDRGEPDDANRRDDRGAMKVLCSCTPLSGHVLPLLPIAEALRDAGHDVVVATGDAFAPLLGELELTHRRAGPSFDDMVGRALQRWPDTPFEHPEDGQRFGWGRLFSDMRVRLSVDDVRAVADVEQPSVVLHEVADMVGPLVAAERAIPSVDVGIGLVPLPHLVALAAGAVAPYWADVGLDPRADAGLYRSLFLNQVPRSVQRRSIDDLPAVSDLRPVTHGDGEPLPDDLAHLGVDRPLLYVTFGTVFGDAALAQRVLDAAADLDLDVLATVGDVVDLDAIVAPPKTVVRSFVAQGAVLGRCRAVVCHGGVGSMLGPLAHGLPMVVVPLGADQYENAVALRDAGVAEVVDVADTDVESLAGAIRRALDDGARHDAAALVRAEVGAMPTAAEVVGRIETLIA